MIAIVLAAGFGSRLKEVTKGRQKVLLEVNGKMLLKRVLDNLVSEDRISKIIIVVGYNPEQIKEVIGDSYLGKKIVYVFDPFYYTKGNSSSLWITKDYVDEDLVFTVGDLIISKNNVKTILDSEHNASILLDSSEGAKKREDVLKISLKNGKVDKIIKEMDENLVYGASCGFYKFKLDVAKIFFKIMDDYFVKGENTLPFNVPIEDLCHICDVFPVEADGSFCMDIDTPEDLEIVEKELKKIEGNR